MTEWEPGDPLHRHSDYSHGGYMYNFRDDSLEDECSCADAARWPVPRRMFWNFDTTPDELTVFIDEYHKWMAERPV